MNNEARGDPEMGILDEKPEIRRNPYPTERERGSEHIGEETGLQLPTPDVEKKRNPLDDPDNWEIPDEPEKGPTIH
jgi:hypothetical protein